MRVTDLRERSEKTECASISFAALLVERLTAEFPVAEKRPFTDTFPLSCL